MTLLIIEKNEINDPRFQQGSTFAVIGEVESMDEALSKVLDRNLELPNAENIVHFTVDATEIEVSIDANPLTA